MLNVWTGVGRMVHDAELKQTSSGVLVTSFTLAVERDFVKAGEERVCDYIDFTAWRQTAEFINKYFRKGSWIAISGSLQTRTYEDKEGKKRKVSEIIVDKASFCGGKSETTHTEPATSYNVTDVEKMPWEDDGIDL